MLTFYDLSETAQILFMTAQFVAACMGVCMLPMFHERRWLPQHILPIFILLSGGMLAVFSANVRAEKQSRPLPAVTQWASELPVWIFLLILLAIYGYMIFLLVRERVYQKSTITRFSIKEGLDSLSSGLCFYEPRGRIILSNSCIQELCHKIMGRDLQNAALFWKLLKKGEVGADVLCLSQGDTPSFRLPDGSVWSFANEDLGGICQLIAVDTTQIHDLMVSWYINEYVLPTLIVEEDQFDPMDKTQVDLSTTIVDITETEDDGE